MFKSPESFGGNHESDRAASQANGKKVLSAAEAAKQKEIEDRLRRMMQVQKAKQAAENNHEATSNATPSSAETLSPTAEQTAQKAKGNSAFKRALVGILLGGGVALGAFAAYQAGKQSAQTPVATETVANDADTMNNAESQEEANPFAGEMPNGLQYNYAEYFGEKKSPNSFGGDYSELYGNVEATKQKHFERAFNDPEILASEVFFCFPEAIKDELGVNGLNPRQIEDAMDGENGGELQKRAQEIFEKAVFDEETTINFHLANGPQKTIYSYYEDVNNDGVITPDEKHLEWDTKDRHDAKQFDMTYAFRIIGPDGQERVEYITVTYNMDCGDQHVVEIVPEGIEEHHDDDSTGGEATGSEPTGSEPTGSEPTGSEPTGSEPTPTGTESTGTEGTGNENTDVKDPAAEIRNAGDHVDQQQLNQDVTPATNVNQDQANHQAIEQQKQQDAAAAAAAEQQRQQQAAAEQAAAQAAEQRRQEQAAAEAAAAAEAQAAAERAAAQAAEQQRQQQAAEQAAAAEKAAREQAQREADARATAAAATAASNTGDTAEQRANDFANGNY